MQRVQSQKVGRLVCSFPFFAFPEMHIWAPQWPVLSMLMAPFNLLERLPMANMGIMSATEGKGYLTPHTLYLYEYRADTNTDTFYTLRSLTWRGEKRERRNEGRCGAGPRCCYRRASKQSSKVLPGIHLKKRVNSYYPASPYGICNTCMRVHRHVLSTYSKYLHQSRIAQRQVGARELQRLNGLMPPLTYVVKR